MKFNPNKKPIEVIKEGAFGGTYFRDIYSGVNGKRYRNSWKEFNELKNIDQKFYCSDYYDVELNKYKVKTRTSLRVFKLKVGLMKQILMNGFNGILDTSQEENLQITSDK